MKLLRHFLHLRMAGRRLLSARARVRGRVYTVTVPLPLGRAAATSTRGGAAPADAGVPTDSTPAVPRQCDLCLVASR
jgi:hypothetical protein